MSSGNRPLIVNTLLSITAVVVLMSGVLVAGRSDRGAGQQTAELRESQPLTWLSQSGLGESFTLGASPPRMSEDDESVVVVFDGSSWDGWVTREGAASGWNVRTDGSIEVAPGAGDALSREHFGDLQLHLEFMCPLMEDASGQARGNSGVYLHGLYEVQVLDSVGLEPLQDGCGAIYGVAPPTVNASLPPNEWQTYDIFFRGPRFDTSGAVAENPRITVLHNGILIQNNVEIPGSTRAAAGTDMIARGPILLQDHGNVVRYRNIWVRRLN